MKIEKASIVSAFSVNTVGSKVVNEAAFMECLKTAIENHEPAKDRQAGQHFLPLPSAINTVSAGVGARTTNPEDYVLRSYRGRVSAYLRREKAAPVESLAVIVYTAEAYLGDPEVAEVEAIRIGEAGATHVIVAVLASAGPRAPLTPHRFVQNLAGGNREATLWGADEIRAKAKDIKDYDDAWCVVAD